ncbi:MAG: hypothetical protein Q9225_002190 [Loekoesia sp. 1 TL-2023]
MPSNFPRPTLGDQYLYTSQHDLGQHDPGSGGSSLPYHASQTQSFQDEIRNSTRNIQSANTYAFNINDQNLDSSYRDCGEPRLNPSQAALPWSVRPPIPLQAYEPSSTSQPLPGLPSALSAQRSDIELQVNNDESIATVQSNSVGTATVEQVGSDLEEGELSEGTEHNSPRIRALSRATSNQQSSAKANGTLTKVMLGHRHRDPPHITPRSDRVAQGTARGHQSPALGVDSMENQQPTYVGIRTTRQAANGRAKSDWAGRDRTPPTQRQAINSVKALHEGARRAVKQLRSHDIGYLQFLEEYIDSNLLRKLYNELNITISESIQSRTSPDNAEPQRASAPAFPEHKPGINFIQSVPSQQMDMPGTTADSGLQHLSNSQGWSPQDSQDKCEANVAGKEISQISQETREDWSNHGQGLSTVSDKSVTVEKAPMHPKIDVYGVSAGDTSTDQKTNLSPTVNSAKLGAAQVVHQGPVHSPAATTSSKPPASKVTTKPVDRKDYIARLLAAKAGKALPVTNASKHSPDTIPQKELQNPSAGTKNEDPKIDKSGSGQAPSKDTLKQVEESSDGVVNTAARKSAAAEAKKREQTELARRKIEELKRRSETIKKAPPLANEAPASFAGQQIPPVQTSTIASSDQSTIPSTKPPLIQNVSQHSYFPLQNATFTIPGLFMSSQQTQPDLQSKLLPTTPIPEKSQQATLPESTTSYLSSVDAVPQELASSLDTSVLPNQENKFAEKAPVAETTIPRAVSNPRKRPTAVDFIEPVPSKSRRLGSSKAENSVVFEVSDDEADESVHDTSEMQVDGDQGAKPSQVVELQISRSNSVAQANLHQQLALSDINGKSELLKSTPSISLQAFQLPVKHKESGGLRSKEEEIARMNRKIAEMEQRRKSKQVASRAQTPGTPGRPTSAIKTADNNTDVSSIHASTRHSSPPTNQRGGDKRIYENVQNSESIPKEELPTKQHTPSIERTESPANGAVIGTAEQQQRRRAEIESKILSMNAIVEDFVTRLQNLRREEGDLQDQIQRQINDKRVLREELDRILQSGSTAGSSGQTNGETSEVELADVHQPPGE